MTEASALPAECGRELQIAVITCMRTLGGEVMLLDEVDDFAPGVARLVRIGRLVARRACRRSDPE